MSRLSQLACYAGLIAGATAPNFSAAVSIWSATVNPHGKSLDIGLPSFADAGTAPAADDKTDECLPVLNKLRVEGLNNLLSELAKAEENDVTSSLQPSKKLGDKTKVTEIAVELAGEDKNCAATNAAASPYSGLVITFDYSTAFDCEALINESFTAGLSHLQQANYDASDEAAKMGKAPLDNLAAKNLARMVSTKAKKVACAATTDCEQGKNVLFCYFIEPLEEDETKPIEADVYEALLERQRGSAWITVPGITAALFSLALILLS
ncbi:SAG family member [Eimeria necatrix]|uniref:SAG family member n=1 Tax=Eimeria necatrix TaxID=51315 RepID=U6MGK3_9EIME|nr:SAG family member [Eimeria necatrix]CDJ62193.1 SAG family member [Eimeria necatrix]